MLSRLVKLQVAAAPVHRFAPSALLGVLAMKPTVVELHLWILVEFLHGTSVTCEEGTAAVSLVLTLCYHSVARNWVTAQSEYESAAAIHTAAVSSHLTCANWTRSRRWSPTTVGWCTEHGGKKMKTTAETSKVPMESSKSKATTESSSNSESSSSSTSASSEADVDFEKNVDGGERGHWNLDLTEVIIFLLSVFKLIASAVI